MWLQRLVSACRVSCVPGWVTSAACRPCEPVWLAAGAARCRRWVLAPSRLYRRGCVGCFKAVHCVLVAATPALALPGSAVLGVGEMLFAAWVVRGYACGIY